MEKNGKEVKPFSIHLLKLKNPNTTAKWRERRQRPGQLSGDVATDEDGLQVDPQVLHQQPALQDLVGVGQVRHPLLNRLQDAIKNRVSTTAKYLIPCTKA